MPLLLNVGLDELPALLAAMDLALKAASGYSVRTDPSRDVVSSHWKHFTLLHARIKALEQQKEGMMTRGLKDAKYLHVHIDEVVHERLYAYARQRGGGKVVPGSLAHIVERALTEYMDRHHIPLTGEAQAA